MKSVMSHSLLSFSLLLLLFFFSVNSNATDFGTLSATGGGADASVGRGLFKTVVARPVGQGAGLAGEFILLLKRRPYSLTGLRGLTPGAIAGRAAGLAKTLGPLGLAFTLGQLIWDPVLGIWKKLQEESGYPEGRWCVNKGYPGESCAADPASACSGYYNNVPAPRIYVGVRRIDDYNYYCQECNSDSSCSPIHEYYVAQRDLSCSADFVYNPSTNMCEQRQYVPASDNDLYNAIINKVNESSSNASNQASTNVAHDEPGSVSDAGPIYSVSGPASSSPDVSTNVTETKTNVADQDGDGLPEVQTDTTTTTTTTVYNMTYDNSVHIQESTTTQSSTTTSITYSTTNQTTVLNQTNSPTTTTVVNNGNATTVESDPDNSSSSTQSEWPSFCSWASVVCEFIDWVKGSPDLPAAPLLPVQDISATSQTWSLNLGSGSCPADVDVSLIQGQHLTYSYSQLCWTLSTYIYPIVMLMSSILSLYILAGVKVD